MHMMLKPLIEKSGLSSILQMFGIGAAPANAAEPAPTPTTPQTPTTPTLTNVSNKTTTEIAADSNNKALKGTVTPPAGKTNITFLDVGHAGTIKVGDQSLDSTNPEHQKILNSLTLNDLLTGKTPDGKKVEIQPGRTIDPGAISPFDRKTEFELNVLQAYATADSLRKAGFQPEIFVINSKSITPRAERANQLNAAFSISFHNNAHTGNAYGKEGFYFDGGPNNEKFAKNTIDNIDKNQKENGIEQFTRGAKTDDKTQHSGLGFLRKQDKERPAILLEGVFIDNEKDYRLLVNKDGNYNRKYLESYANGIVMGAKDTLKDLQYKFSAQNVTTQVAKRETEISPPPNTPTPANNKFASLAYGR